MAKKKKGKKGKKRKLSSDDNNANNELVGPTKTPGQHRPQNKKKPKRRLLPTDDDGKQKKRRSNHEDDSGNDHHQNEFRRRLDQFLATTTVSEREAFFSDRHVAPERRAELWMQQAEIGEELVNRFSWAVPNDDCLKVLSAFSPLVEIGCGANAYWCRQARRAGIDMIGYDVEPTQGGKIAGSDNDDDDDNSEGSSGFVVQKGGPEVLSKHKDRTLFLCYPDENDGVVAQQSGYDDDNDVDDDDPDKDPVSLGEACLQNWRGEYVIHVGELYGDTLSAAQAPWGRSSSPMFQQQLAAEYHCVLKLPMSNGWLHVRDSLSVWKRSELCSIVFAPDDDDEDGSDDAYEEVQYRHIPLEERLPQCVAAPYLAHLLPDNNPTTTTVTKSSKEEDKEKTSESLKQVEHKDDVELTVSETQPDQGNNDEIEATAPKKKKKKSKKRKPKTHDTPTGAKEDGQTETPYECPW